MNAKWEAPAKVLIEHAAAGWEGLRSLLYAASHATLKLSLGVPLATGVDLTFAAMDIREARDELEWLDNGVVERGARELTGDQITDAPDLVRAKLQNERITVPEIVRDAILNGYRALQTRRPHASAASTAYASTEFSAPPLLDRTS